MNHQCCIVQIDHNKCQYLSPLGTFIVHVQSMLAKYRFGYIGLDMTPELSFRLKLHSGSIKYK